MPKIWSYDEEAAHLAKRFATVPNRAAWARQHDFRGGPSMINQHIHGHRSIGLDHAVAYARAFGVSLAEISPRLAMEQSARKGIPLTTEAGLDSDEAAQAVTIETALHVVLNAFATCAPENRGEARLLVMQLLEGIRTEEALPRTVELLSPTPSMRKLRRA